MLCLWADSSGVAELESHRRPEDPRRIASGSCTCVACRMLCGATRSWRAGSSTGEGHRRGGADARRVSPRRALRRTHGELRPSCVHRAQCRGDLRRIAASLGDYSSQGGERRLFAFSGTSCVRTEPSSRRAARRAACVTAWGPAARASLQGGRRGLLRGHRLHRVQRALSLCRRVCRPGLPGDGPRLSSAPGLAERLVLRYAQESPTTDSTVARLLRELSGGGAGQAHAMLAADPCVSESTRRRCRFEARRHTCWLCRPVPCTRAVRV